MESETTKAPDLAAFLTRLRAALHFDSTSTRDIAVRAHGVGSVSGLRASITWQCHADGRTRLDVASSLPDSSAFDGVAGRHVGPSGVLESLDLADLDELRMSSALFSGTWLNKVTPILFDRVEHAGDTIVLHARMGPERWRQSFRIVCATSSLLPRRLETLSGDGAVFEVDGFAPGGFGQIPRSLRWRRGWLADTVEITRIGPADQACSYVLLDTRGHRAARHDPSVGSRTRATRSPRGRLPLVRATVDRRDVGWFLLDSGAGSSAIDVTVADALGLAGLGRTWVVTPTGGLGAGYRRGSTLTVGPLTIHDPLLVELDLASISSLLGVRLAGILGFDLFAQIVVRLLHEPLEVELFPAEHDPAALWHDVRFQDRVPVLEAVLGADGNRLSSGLVALDTASSAPLRLQERIAFELGLKQRTVRRTVRGVSGAGSLGVRTLPWIDVGGERFERVHALISGSVEGSSSPMTTLGSLGWGLFRGCELLLDWPRRRISLSRAQTESRPAMVG